MTRSILVREMHQDIIDPGGGTEDDALDCGVRMQLTFYWASLSTQPLN